MTSRISQHSTKSSSSITKTNDALTVRPKRKAGSAPRAPEYEYEYPILLSRETLTYEIALQENGEITCVVEHGDSECVNLKSLSRFIVGRMTDGRGNGS